MSFSIRRAKAPRKKIVVQDDQDDDEEQPIIVKASTLKKNLLPTKASASKPKPLTTATSKPKAFGLSFGEDEEEHGVVTIKKTAASRRMAKAKLNRDLMPDLDEPAIEESATFNPYSAENLRALKASQRTAPPSKSSAASDHFSSATSTALPTDTASIPDANAIHAARKLREQKRAAGISGVVESDSTTTKPNPNDGFISLSSSSKEVGRVVQKDSRLMHEDDEEGDGEEAFDDYKGDRLTFGSAAVKEEEERRHKEFEGNLVEAQGSIIVDEEVDRWEREKISKGKKHAPLNTAVAPKTPAPVATKIPIVVSILPITDVCSRLNAALEDLQISHQLHTSQLTHLKEELDRSVASSQGLESDLKSSADRYDYFNDLRVYVGDLAEFLDVKFPEMENLEAQQHTVLASRDKAAALQRQTAMDYWYATFMGWAPPPKEVPAGPAMNPDLSGHDQAHEGMTDSEIVEVQANIADGHQHLFDGVANDFRSLGVIKQRFETWRAKFPKEYDEAYGALSIPGIFELFIRHELLEWDHTKSGCAFEKMRWHHFLADFGHGADVNGNAMDADGIRNGDGDGDAGNPDANVLTRVVEKVVIPRIKALADVYDPYSEDQTKTILSAVSQCLNYVEKDGEVFKGMITSFESRLNSIVHAVVERYNFFITAPRTEWTEHTVESRNHWFWTTYKVFAAILKWSPYFSRASSHAMAVDTMLNRHLTPILNMPKGADDLVKIEKIVQSFPRSWLKPKGVPPGEEHTVPVFLTGFNGAVANYMQVMQRQEPKPDRAFWVRFAAVFEKMNNRTMTEIVTALHRDDVTEGGGAAVF
ncbi:GC-rich sequence DNA-binding factor [Thoreauomyces humboldtii]|nr:GC-rich sequence DNA-binding factor [Thoreauomyces humboldtii]